MTRAAVALPLVALAGCDAVFGLDRDRARDAMGAPVVVSGRITQKYLHGDPGLVLVAETVPLAQSEAPTAVVGGKPAELGWSASEGIFTFTANEGEPYRLLYANTEYQLTAPTLMIDRVIPGRPDAIAPQPGTVLRMTPTSPLPAGANVFVMSTGIFSVTKPNTVSPSELSLAWDSAAFRGTPSLLDAAKHDAAYLVTFADDAAGYEVMTSYVRLSVTLAQGQTTTVSGPVSPVLRDRCVTVDPAPVESELERVHAAFPALRNGEASWTLFQAARPELGVPVAYTVASDRALLGAADVQYGVPFPSFGPVMTYTAQAWSSGGALDPTAYVTYLQQLDTSGPCRVQPPPTGVAIPTGPRLAGVAIAEDVTIGVPASEDAVLTWKETPGSLPSTSYRVSVFEIDGAAATLKRDIRTAAPRAVIASELLHDGGRYRLEIVAGNGLPGFAAGEVTRQHSSYGAGILRTGVFEVSR
ncbi:MAG: hypothetical protein JNL83_30735 [Myxococcales bacterium]|nr:hypothetical protein [Myxococcales bacterium]